MKRVLFLDRDGTLIVEPPEDYQVDSFDNLLFPDAKMEFLSLYYGHKRLMSVVN